MTEPSKDLVVQSTAYSRANLAERQQYVSALAAAGTLLPKDLTTFAPVGPNGQMVKVGDRGKVMLMTETGDMLGIHPMAALTGVHIIEGRPSISANLMGGLVRKAGHRLRVTTTGSIEEKTFTARAELTRSDDPDFTFVVEWSIGRATRADLYPGKDKSNWRIYPEAMLKARAISEVIREGAPDVLMGGNVYTPEELGAQVDQQGEPINLEARVEPRPAQAQPRPQAPIVDPDLPEPTVAQNAPEAAAEPAPQADAQTGEVLEDEAAVGGPAGDEAADELAERNRVMQERATAYAQNGGEEEAQVVVEEPTDWVALLEEAKDSQTVRELYREASRLGLLNEEIQWGDAKVTLSTAITAVGSSMVSMENAAEGGE